MKDDSGLDQSDSTRNYNKREPIGLAHKLNVGICEKGVHDKSKVWAIGRIMGPSVVMGKAVGWASLKAKRSTILDILSLGSP